MRDLRLATRILRGAGAGTAVDAVMSVAGVAIAACALLLGLSVPVVIAAQDEVDQARAPRSSDSPAADSGLHVVTSTESLAGRPFVRVTVTGVSPKAPRPPGVGRWPAPGSTLVSPGLADLLADRPELARKAALGTVVGDPIGEPGVAGPAELVSYTVLDSTPTAGGVAGFGQPGSSSASTPSSMMLLELGTLVFLPSLMFLWVCLNTSAARRSRSYAGLVVIGVAPARCARVYGMETATVGLLGGAAGVGLFFGVQGWCGASGIFGLTWWGSVLRPGPVTLVASALVVLALLVIVYRVSNLALRRRLSVAPHRAARGVPSPRFSRVKTAALALIGGVVLLGLGFETYVILAARRSSTFGTNTGLYDRTVLVAVLTAVLAAVVARPLSRHVVGRLGSRGPVPLGLGTRAALYRWARYGWFVTAVAAVSLTFSLSYTFGEWVRAIVATTAGDHRSISYQLQDVPPSARAALARDEGYDMSVSLTVPGPDGPTGVVATRCTPGRATPPECPSVGHRSPRAPGQVRVEMENDRARLVDVAKLPVDPALEYSPAAAVLDLDANPWVWAAKDGVVDVATSLADEDLEGALGRLHERLPTVPLQTGDDTDMIRLQQEQLLLLRLGGATAALMCLGSIAVTLVQVRRESMRSVNALLALGAPSSVLRSSSALAAAAPTAVGGLLVGLVALLTSWSLLALFGPQFIDLEAMAWALLPGPGIAIVVGVAAYVWGGVRRFDRRLAQAD